MVEETTLPDEYFVDVPEPNYSEEIYFENNDQTLDQDYYDDDQQGFHYTQEGENYTQQDYDQVQNYDEYDDVEYVEEIEIDFDQDFSSDLLNEVESLVSAICFSFIVIS